MQDDKKKWTVMVFMGAATIKGEEDMLDAAEDDLKEMASVGSGPVESGNGDELNIFVQAYSTSRPKSGPLCAVRTNYARDVRWNGGPTCW